MKSTYLQTETACALTTENTPPSLFTLSTRWQGCKKAAVPSGHLSGCRDPRRDWRRRAWTPLVSVLPPPRRGQSPAHLSAYSPGGQVPAGIGCFHGNHSHGQRVGESERHTFRCVKPERLGGAQKSAAHVQLNSLLLSLKMVIAFTTVIYST